MKVWLPHTGYFALMASLPHLPRFDRAQRLPINRERLDARLAWLKPDDALCVQQAEHFLEWQRQPIERTDAHMLSRFDALMREVRQPALRRMVEFRFGLRVVVGALRRRRRGDPAPVDAMWSTAPWAKHIARNWGDPAFKLAAQCPWLPQARALLERGETLGLERLLMGVVWDHLGTIGRVHHFDLDAVLVYLFRWDILERWLGYRPDAAAARIDRLVTEALGDGGHLFT